jgi:hypothetical protein
MLYRMTYNTNRHRSHKSCMEYKSDNRANTDIWNGYTSVGPICLGGVGISCRLVTSAMSRISFGSFSNFMLFGMKKKNTVNFVIHSIITFYVLGIRVLSVRLLRLLDLRTWLLVSVPGRQGMLTPLMHLISGVIGYPSFWFLRTDDTNFFSKIMIITTEVLFILIK